MFGMTGKRTQILRFAQNDRMGDWNDGSVEGNGVGGKIVTAGVRAGRNDGRNCMCKELRFLLVGLFLGYSGTALFSSSSVASRTHLT